MFGVTSCATQNGNGERWEIRAELSDYVELRALLLASKECHLVDRDALTGYLLRSHAESRRGLYWVAGNIHEVGYGNYIAMPEGRTLEFGNLMFDAYVVLRCNPQ